MFCVVFFFCVVFSLCIVCIFNLSYVLYFPARTNVNGTVQPNGADVPLRFYSLVPVQSHSLCLIGAGSRYRRAASPCAQSKPRPVCTLLLVADYRFFRGTGGRNIRRTTSYLVCFTFSFLLIQFYVCCLVNNISITSWIYGESISITLSFIPSSFCFCLSHDGIVLKCLNIGWSCYHDSLAQKL